MGLKRKLQRKKTNAFFKEFKKTMKKFKTMVRCTACDREPNPGENIDSWYINQQSQNINLICPECHTQGVMSDD